MTLCGVSWFSDSVGHVAAGTAPGRTSSCQDADGAPRMDTGPGANQQVCHRRLRRRLGAEKELPTLIPERFFGEKNPDGIVSAGTQNTHAHAPMFFAPRIEYSLRRFATKGPKAGIPPVTWGQTFAEERPCENLAANQEPAFSLAEKPVPTGVFFPLVPKARSLARYAALFEVFF